MLFEKNFAKLRLGRSKDSPWFSAGDRVDQDYGCVETLTKRWFQTGRITGRVVRTAACPDAVWSGVAASPSTTRCAFCPTPSPYWPASTSSGVSAVRFTRTSSGNNINWKINKKRVFAVVFADKLPGPPTNVRVETADAHTVTVKWDPPAKNPQTVEVYRWAARAIDNSGGRATIERVPRLALARVSATLTDRSTRFQTEAAPVWIGGKGRPRKNVFSFWKCDIF